MKETKKLVDINDVKIDASLPKEKRIEEYVTQIRDPNNFMCGKYQVKVSFAKNGLSLEECLAGILL